MASDAQVERVAQVAAAAMDGYSEGASHIEDYRIIARALADHGMLRTEYPPDTMVFRHYQITSAGTIRTVTHQWIEPKEGSTSALAAGGQKSEMGPRPDVLGPRPSDASCGCARCYTGRFAIMHVCADCGNKRCPRATWHGYQCNRSNEPGQVAVLADDEESRRDDR